VRRILSKSAVRALQVILILAFGCHGLVHAQSDATLSRITCDGTLGHARIGMTLLVDSAGAFLRGHYYYAKYLKDIALTGAIENGKLILHEPDGGTFTLAFKGNGSENGQPLNFENSVGLEGDWTDNRKSLPVTLGFSIVSKVTDDSRWYEQVTDESDAAFEARVRGFRNAVLKGDSATAAQYVDFPLRVNLAGKHQMVRSAAQLSAEWNQIFTPQCLDAIRRAVPHEMFVRNGQAMLGDGVAWFGAKGAQVVNVP
jgi:hypothetical protein